MPSIADINAMRNLREIMERPSQPTSNAGTSINESSQVDPIRTGKPDVDAMAEILRRFNNASNSTATRLVEESNTDSRLREALTTQATTTGVKIGAFEVVVVQESISGKSRKTYNVVDSRNHKALFSNLSIIEAAHCIVRYLNKGLRPTDNPIRTIVALEEVFNRNRTDAARFKHRYERCVKLNESKAGNVFADRFQVSRGNALTAHSQIKSILENIR